MSFDKSMRLNFIKSYSKKIKKFNSPNKDFFGGQKETKLIPY